VQPKLASLDDDPALKAAYDAWSASRADFGKRLHAREDAAVAEKWQRTYVQGRGGVEDGVPAYHLSKRRLKAPE
jgi:anti-sigma factor RsiW